ncbi:hypothetical protein IQ235_08255 [Oscillatoriales cyanobacterium LEGE 11467]|uniref:Uncharacterized protein n=1 Tax=Zarconia navalis LEGE 11467 TaxID=1828826 RepID=A0A928VWD9_9CYAN|nr:hypothetical protein [Zarconia navalis]MBE9040769.1 hypothetical protein [Zarconia navalis LEGE 11467]
MKSIERTIAVARANQIELKLFLGDTVNIPSIVFASLITSGLGAGLGVAAAEIAPSGRPTCTHARYALVGAVAGLTIGAAQECVRGLKIQADLEEIQHDRSTRKP